MKRSFSIITVLITISLIGIIIIQYSWLKNVAAVRKEQIADRLDLVEYEVVEEIVEEKINNAPQLPIDVLPKGAQEQLLELIGPQTAAERYSVEEIHLKIQKALEANGIKGTKFKFAVLNDDNNSAPDLASPDFEKYYQLSQTDSFGDYILKILPIADPNGDYSAMLTAKETFVLIGYDLQGVVIRHVGSQIIIAAVFTLILIIAFYITVRTILTQKKLSEMKTDFINNLYRLHSWTSIRY